MSAPNGPADKVIEVEQQDSSYSRRNFLTGAAVAVGAVGLTSLVPAPALASTPTAVRTAATRAVGTRRPVIRSDRQGYNRRWFAPNLEGVYTPTTTDQVADVVTDALSTHGKNVKVTSGRHCYENFVYNDQTHAIIDMSALNQVGFDPEYNSYFVDAGCENWTVYRTMLNTFNRTLPAGSCYSVGAGGHITGGGYGLLSRLHGLTVDHLSAVDIVTWDAGSSSAKLRHVSEQSSDKAERDLFWALRGAGGGNFGVITRYYFADPPVAPEHATIWTLAWNWSDMTSASFAALLASYADMIPTMPDTDFTLLRLTHVAKGQLGMTLQVASPAGTSFAQHRRSAEASVASAQKRFSAVAPSVRLRQPLGGHPGYMSTAPASQSAVHLTYLEALQNLNGIGPNEFGKYKSAYMKKAFPAAQVEAIYHWLNVSPAGADMSQALVQVDSYGGAINEYSATSTPVPQRSSIMKLQYQTYWNNDSVPGTRNTGAYREQSETQLTWINDLYRAVYAEYGGTPNPANDTTGTVGGCYYNYPDNQLGTHASGDVDSALWLYFLDNFRKNPRNLVDVKKRWDPQNYFHHAQSIPIK